MPLQDLPHQKRHTTKDASALKQEMEESDDGEVSFDTDVSDPSSDEDFEIDMEEDTSPPRKKNRGAGKNDTGSSFRARDGSVWVQQEVSHQSEAVHSTSVTAGTGPTEYAKCDEQSSGSSAVSEDLSGHAGSSAEPSRSSTPAPEACTAAQGEEPQGTGEETFTQISTPQSASKKIKRQLEIEEIISKEIRAVDECRAELVQRFSQPAELDEAGRFSQTVVDLLRRMPEDCRPEAMWRVHNLLFEMLSKCRAQSQ